MNITVQSQGFETNSTIERFARRSVAAVLHRFDDSVVAVAVYMKDTNGPKGGVDKHVTIRVRLRDRQEVSVGTRRENLFAAIKAGSRRIRRAVRRQVRKSRRIDRKRLCGTLFDGGVSMAARR